ncbi:MAG: hypothetical protein KAG61_04835 [Bacteriovoracaceae bacterium]|nr:hypothetical protein [Bacteriovoracaceae bacterium]
MKALIPIALMVLSCSAMANVYQLLNTKVQDDVTVEENGSDVSVSFHISQLETESSKSIPLQNFEKIIFNSLQVDAEAGMPAMPFHSVIVKGLPADFSVDYNLGKGIDFDGVVPAPAMPEKLRCTDCTQPELTVDWSSYASAESNMFKKEYLGEFRGTQLTKVTFFPASFNGVKETFTIYPEANFELRSHSKASLKKMVMPSDIITEADLNKKYLIITPAKFSNAMEKFVAWKTEMGYDVDMFTLESVGETAEEIQKFIHARYNDPATKFTYGLLVGHEKNFPTFYKSTSTDSTTPTDLPYFTFGGEGDYIPDAFNGRFVVDKVEEVERIIAKTIEYEAVSYTDKSGLKRTIGMASDEGSNPTDVEYVKAMLVELDNVFGMTPKYFLQKKSDSTPTNVNALMSKGVAWLNYIGHGSGYSWPSQRKTYRASHIKNIDSKGKVKPVIIDVACMNGNYTYGRGFLGVEFMNAKNKGNPTGAVAYYGGSVNISWHPPAIMAVGMNRVIAKKKLEHLGEALLAGHLYLTKNYSRITEIKQNYIWYMLQGDPSLKLNL